MPEAGAEEGEPEHVKTKPADRCRSHCHHCRPPSSRYHTCKHSPHHRMRPRWSVGFPSLRPWTGVQKPLLPPRRYLPDHRHPRIGWTSSFRFCPSGWIWPWNRCRPARRGQPHRRLRPQSRRGRSPPPHPGQLRHFFPRPCEDQSLTWTDWHQDGLYGQTRRKQRRQSMPMRRRWRQQPLVPQRHLLRPGPPGRHPWLGRP
mmetsp:Transcript_12069/g.34506  ORF Transcript_12069/g.34506 Transcript_12069/m.34506 type:complete len:201 (-) Transcript_12069:342-944(-)